MNLKLVNKTDYQAKALSDAASVLNADLSVEGTEQILEQKNRSPEYSDGFDELMAVDDLLGQLEGDSLLMSYVDDRDYSRVSTRSAPGFRIWTASIAASVFMMIGAGLLWVSSGGQQEAVASLYKTNIGEQKIVSLPDGSRLNLNTSSKVLVEHSDSSRKVILERGEVYFDVVADPSRPFQVVVGDKAVTVLGTEFNVDRRGDGFELSVTEGAVALRGVGQELQQGVLQPVLQNEPFPLDSSGQHKLIAGVAVRYSAVDGSLMAYQLSEDESSFSWRAGILHFSGEGLSEVVLELNRYSAKRIIIADKAVMDIPVFASIKLGDMTTALLLLEGALSLQVDHQFDKVIISGK